MTRLRSLPSIQNLVLLTMLAIAGVSAESFAPDDSAIALWPLALAAGAIGLALGLLRTPDSVSHLIAIGGGFGTALVLAALRLAQDVPDASFRDRVVSVSNQLRDWYLGTGSRENTNELLVIILLQMIVWLVSYLAAWSLARQGWVSVAILVPGAIVFTTRVAGPDQPDGLLEMFIVLSVVLMARVTFVRRAGERSDSASSPRDRRGWMSLLTATAVAILVVMLGTSTPEDFSSNTLKPMVEQAGESYLGAQDRVTDWIEENTGLSGNGSPDIDDYPRYTAFDDAFSIGGELNLSDQPEVAIRTNGKAPYLSAQSYDAYTGRGWESTVEDTFDEEGPDGIRYSPELTFRPGQRVPYSPAVSQGRTEVTMEVTPLGPPADRIYADGEYLTSNERASVRMAWLQMDGMRFPLREMDLATIPPDLKGIASQLVRSDDLSVEGDGGLLYPPAAEERDRMQESRANLSERFIDVSWSVASDGRVDVMVVTGQVPVYDDNVAVERANNRRVNQPYQVTSLASTATDDDLRAASTSYPAWASDRYVPLPDSVTERTIELTHELTAGVSNPFDQAKIIESFLRQHIHYDISVGIPDQGVDIVDYVLFEQPEGYCEHYASAMTVMMRVLGVPARTVVGYFPGELDAERGAYIYRQENAHAWTEAFFPGYGWIPFEPTASQPASTFDGATPEAMPETPVVTPTPVEPQLQTATPGAATPATDDTVEPMVEPVTRTPDDGGTDRRWLVLIGVAAAALLAVGGMLWLVLARMPAMEPRLLFSAMVRWGRMGGVSGDTSVTPREYARSVGRRYPDLERDASRIVDVYEDERYGARPPEQGRLRQAADALRNVQRGVIRRIARLGR